MWFYILIRLFFLFVSITSTTALCPLCKLIKSQQFAQIHLQSITYQSEKQLLVFTNDYKCPASFNDSSLKIDFASDYGMWNQGFPVEVIWSKTSGSAESIYVISTHKKVALNVVTNSTEYIWSIGKKSMMISIATMAKPEYAIVHNRVKNETHGFIINKGKYEITQCWLN